jgi:hypothetical protein
MITDDASDTRTFLETMRKVDGHRLDVDRVLLMRALGEALDRAGHFRLTATARPPSLGNALGALAIPMLFWGLGASIGVAIGASAFESLMLAGGLFVVYFVMVGIQPTTAQRGAYVVIAGWSIAAIVLVFTESALLWWTHVLPGTVTTLVALGLSRLHVRRARDVVQALGGVAKSAPYVAPVVLVAVLLPALTADVWQLAANIGVRNLLSAACLSVGLLLLLVWLQLRNELEPALAARCRALAARATTPEQSRATLVARLDLENSETRALVDELGPTP